MVHVNRQNGGAFTPSERHQRRESEPIMGSITPTALLSTLSLAALGTAVALGAGAHVGAASTAMAQEDPREEALQEILAAAGITVAEDRATLAFPAQVEIRGDALEYLLVNPHGAVHEAMFVTGADPELLSTAFLLTGAEPGTNVRYEPVDPPPTEQEMLDGARTHDVIVPAGKPLYLHAAWREPAGAVDPATGAQTGESVHFHRVEDLILDVERGRTMRRHGFVWLGSRMIDGAREGDAERFAATATGNLMSTTFFADGFALMTTALPECTSQTIWFPNSWLLPPRGSEVLLVASDTPLASLPEHLREALPRALPEATGPR